MIVEAIGREVTVEVRDLAPGTYRWRLTGLAPYADIVATLELAGGEVRIQPVVLTYPATSPEEPGATPASGGARSGPDRVATPVPTAPFVTGLPDTGVRGAAGEAGPFALMLLATLLLLLAAARLRRTGP